MVPNKEPICNIYLGNTACSSHTIFGLSFLSFCRFSYSCLEYDSQLEDHVGILTKPYITHYTSFHLFFPLFPYNPAITLILDSCERLPCAPPLRTGFLLSAGDETQVAITYKDLPKARGSLVKPGEYLEVHG